ncbi:MAG: NfeD family protein, partial [Acidilobaceae archaeon]
LSLTSSSLSSDVQEEDLGSQYCGVVEKKYGVVEGPGYDRVAGPKTLVVRVEGVISSWTKSYILRVLKEAENRNAPLIIELNTPGGLADVTMDIIAELTRSRVPVIGFVVYKWAESAGTMILVSTHIAAMQPGTIIGSLQPVTYDPTSGVYKPINETKIINPIIKALCEHGATRGRNATALVRFVLHNDNYGADEALKFKVIDLVASDREDLISKVNGLIVMVYGGERVKLELDGSYEFLDLSFSERLLSIISDPLLSGILLSIGALALIFSIASGNLAGMAIGGLLVILGLLGSGLNPNIASLILIAIGALLIFIELTSTPGFGILGGVGVIMMVLGVALMPAIPGAEGFSISQSYINQILMGLYIIGLGAGGLTAFIVYKVLKASRAKPYLWKLEGATGEALDDIKPGKPGFVIVEGEYWKATSEEEIGKGDKVIVVGKEDHALKVRKAQSK